MKDDDKAAVDRRDFLRKVGIGTVGAGAALTTRLMTSARADSESDYDMRKARYRLTDHIKNFYRVNRYPA